MKLKQMKWFEKARGSVYSFGRPYFISLRFNFNYTARRTDPPKMIMILPIPKATNKSISAYGEVIQTSFTD